MTIMETAMELNLDPTSPVPLYLQMVEQVRNLIAIGSLRPGDRLPPVRDLAARARVNRNTAARAVQRLEQDGLVQARVGQGTYILDRPGQIDPQVRDQAVDDLMDRVVREAATLGVPLEELGWRFSRRVEAFRTIRLEGGAS
jgi:GntR family transcriptional regulator